jgi:hypothetical protein
MQSLRTKQAGGLVADGQAKGASADDLYSCGETDIKLMDRLIGVLEDTDYPSINTFLLWIHGWSEHCAQNDAFPDALKGTYVGDGRYTYEIV